MNSIPLSLYIHLPWCTRKCPYCDFNSHPAIGGMDEPAYINALTRDLIFDLEENGNFIGERQINSIFIGGGTPSLFSAAGVAQILQTADQYLTFTDDIEITLEANPGSSEQARFSGYRSAGVNRLSIGIQSFDDGHLKALGRVHGRAEALVAARAARAAGFDNFNLDLMYALPDQNLETALADLQQAMDLQPTHISYYQLTMEPGTHFYLHPPRLPDDELAWDMQLQGESLLANAGFEQYEVSAYARNDRPCRHNLNYWQFGDYLGIGAGAHGKLSDPVSGRVIRTAKQRIPQKYMQQAGSAAALTEYRDILQNDRSFEFLLNALRLKAGFNLQQYILHSGLDDTSARLKLAVARQQSLLDIDNDWVQTTARGWHHIDSILTSVLEQSGEEV